VPNICDHRESGDILTVVSIAVYCLVSQQSTLYSYSVHIIVMNDERIVGQSQLIVQAQDSVK
jgi:hypothetical protein